jgi:hypothetical protein
MALENDPSARDDHGGRLLAIDGLERVERACLRLRRISRTAPPDTQPVRPSVPALFDGGLLRGVATWVGTSIVTEQGH